MNKNQVRKLLETALDVYDKQHQISNEIYKIVSEESDCYVDMFDDVIDNILEVIKMEFNLTDKYIELTEEINIVDYWFWETDRGGMDWMSLKNEKGVEFEPTLDNLIEILFEDYKNG